MTFNAKKKLEIIFDEDEQDTIEKAYNICKELYKTMEDEFEYGGMLKMSNSGIYDANFMFKAIWILGGLKEHDFVLCDDPTGKYYAEGRSW